MKKILTLVVVALLFIQMCCEKDRETLPAPAQKPQEYSDGGYSHDAVDSLHWVQDEVFARIKFVEALLVNPDRHKPSAVRQYDLIRASEINAKDNPPE